MSLSWADAGDDDNQESQAPLPALPKLAAISPSTSNKHEEKVQHNEPKDNVEQKSQRPQRDLSTLKEPYTIYLGNLEYEVTKEKKIESFFLKEKAVR